MAIDKKTQPNIDSSDLANYPNGAIRDDDGSGNGTAVDRAIYSDIHEFFAKLMRLAKISYNGIPDKESTGYQLINSLENFAGKNDKIQSITSISGVINIPLKLGTIVANEYLICKPNFNLTTEITIKGNDTTSPVVKSISFEPSDKPFKSGETIRLFYNGTSFVATRLVDAKNLDLSVGERNYLKAATEAEEYAAASQTKATTPYTNGLAFARRVIGLDSIMFLATSLRNGLYPKEHFAIVENLSQLRNRGWFSGLDVGAGGSLAVFGFTSAVATAGSGVDDESFVLVTMPNAMDNLNYRVECFIESQSVLGADNEIGSIVFKPVDENTFNVSVRGLNVIANSLKVHMDVIQL